MMRKRIINIGIFFLLLFIFEGTSFPHHIRGLPHYSYKENYPQVPTVEETKINGSYEIIFSYFNIFDTGNIDLAVYMKNRATGKPYAGKMTFTVFAENERPEDTDPYTAEPDMTNTYRVGWTHEKDGIYYLRISFNDDEGIERTEEFLLQIGKAPANWKLIGIAAGGFLLLFGLVVYKKRISSK